MILLESIPALLKLTVIAIVVLSFQVILLAEDTAKSSSALISFYAECGNIKVRYDIKKAWNLNLIEYKGEMICIDKPGAHYGTVFNFSGVGFIGSGHVENETEEVQKLEIWIDGTEKPFKSLTNDELLKAKKEFKTRRVSKVRDFIITDQVVIKDDLIIETVTIVNEKATQLSFVYNFMSPWDPQMTDYYGVGIDDKVYSGEFTTDGKFKIQKDIKWAAVYNRNDKRGAIEVITEAEQKVGRKWFFFWDKGVYKKGYFRCMSRAKIPEGHKAQYTLIRGFFEASPEQWQSVATEKAENILKKE